MFLKNTEFISGEKGTNEIGRGTIVHRNGRVCRPITILLFNIYL